VSADSVVPSAGNPQSLNRYAYTFNNPLKYTDPSGHCPWCGTLRDFAGGFLAQVVYNASPIPNGYGYVGAADALAVKSDESDAMLVGRLAGNIWSAVASAAEMAGAITMGGGGVAACGTGVGCLAGAPAIAGSVALAGHGAIQASNAIVETGKLNNVLMAKGNSGGSERSRNEIEKSIRSLQKRIAEHQEKIDKRIGFDPVSDDPIINQRAADARLRHLQHEIDNWQVQVYDLQRLLDNLNK
jgi:hypothetical protein